MKKDTLILKPNPTLKDFHAYMAAMVKERGFEKETVSDLFVLFLEECGEMAKAARKATGIKTDHVSKVHDVELEIADVFIYLIEIANRFNVNLEEAFRKKEELNKQRTWK